MAALERSGIGHAFTVPGESFLELLDALRDSPIRLIAARHEAGAGFMAEAYGQLTGQPAACLVTRAVGTANLSIALHTAMQDSTPLVAIAGQVPREFRGREAFQEADLAASFGGLCKAGVELDDPRTVAVEVERMVGLARRGRPGPVLLVLPEDTLGERVDDASSIDFDDDSAAEGHATTREALGPRAAGDGDAALDTISRPAASDSDVRAILARLARARRPLILAGGGVLRSGASAELEAFADAIGIGVVAAWRRPDVFPNASSRYLGATGLGAAPTVRPRLLEADVILALGTRMSQVATFDYAVPGPGTELLQVDIEPGFRGDRPQPACMVRSDARTFLRAALSLLAAGGPGTPCAAGGAAGDASGTSGGAGEAPGSAGETPGSGGEAPLRPGATLATAWAADLARDRAAYLEAAEPPDPGPRGGDLPVHPATVVAALRRHLPPDAILTTDAGNFASWPARYLPVPARGRFLGPTSGAMGYGLPAAVGAAVASRDLDRRARPVIALAGDGGFAMLMAELETAVREGLRLAVIVFDNAMYGTIRMHQERAHPGRVAATDLGRIDLAAFAAACGARGIRVAHDAEVEGAVASAMGDRGVVLVHVLTDPRVISVDSTLAG